VSVDVATTTLHKVVKVSRESIKHNDSERDYFLRFIHRIQMWTILSFGLLFISLLIFLLSNALAEAFRGDKLAILFSLSILMLLVIYILWPIYIHRLEEDIESKFHFFKKINVLYEQNYHDITYNILAALKLLNIPLYDLDKRENMLTNFIEFEIHEEAFTVTVKEVDPNHTILEITLIGDETIEKFNEKKDDSNNRSIGQAQTVDKSQAPSIKSRINGIDLLTNLPLIYLYRRIELVIPLLSSWERSMKQVHNPNEL
jgi:hypothetical protein